MTESQTPVRKTPGWASAGLSDLTVASNPGASLLADRTGWTRVRFGDMVQNLNETQRDPGSAGIERYVGLERLDPGSLHIRSWGRVADGTTFTRRCRPGQTLFGKRRAYQRKVAVAEFDAVVSGDIYVFQARSDRLLPELLPFVCLSERFYQFAVETSAGSLSPRTNWNHLAEFEFALPPLDQQRRIAEILWAVDRVQGAAECTVTELASARRKVLTSRFAQLGRCTPLMSISQIGNVQLGRQRAPKYTTGKFAKPYLRVVNVLDGELDLADVQTMDFEERDFATYSLRPGDVLVTEGDITSPLNVGRCAIYGGEVPDCCFQNTLIRLRVGSASSPEFVKYALQDARYRGVFAEAARTTTVTHLGAARFGRVTLAVPRTNEQRALCDEMARLDECVIACRAYVSQAAVLLRRCIDTLLGGVP